MKATWQADRAYIEAKYQGMEYDPATGMSNGEIREKLEELYRATRHENHARVKAEAFDFVLSSTRIDVNAHDWFVGISEWNQKSIDRAFCSRWYSEVRAQCAPQMAQEEALHSRLKSHLLYLDYCHSVPDWDAVLQLGFPGLRQRAREYRAMREAGGLEQTQYVDKTQFHAAQSQQPLTEEQAAYFDAIDREYDAILRFLGRARDVALSQGNPKCDAIAACLEQLRTGAPRTTYECLQAIWLYFLISEYVDCLQVRSFGNLDRVLYPYYVRDLENGATEEDIRDVFAAFLMQASAMRYYFGHPFYFGGTKANGESEINALSYLILDVYDELGIFDPKLQIKINFNTPREFIRKALEMIRGGHNSINFVCEPAMMRSMRAYGFSEEEARLCDVKGCYEYAVRGDAVDTANVHVNLPKCVELALHDGFDFFSGVQSGPHTGKAEEMDTFEAFYDAFLRQAECIYERGFSIIAAYESHLAQINPTPMFSATIQTSLAKAYDAYAGGVKYSGSGVLLCSPATAADSLAMVKKYVYEQKMLSLAEFRDILDQNWQGAEALRLRIMKDPDKWGNNRELPDQLFKDFTERLARRNNGRRNVRGGYCATSLHNAKQFLEMGWKTAATPDGRLSGEECSKNATSVHGMNRAGATGAIASLAKLDSSLFMGDFPVDIALNPGAVQGEDGLHAMEGLLKTYMANYGHAIHFNVFSAETLRKAQEEPEKYKDLQIRVCGWNVLWNSLSPDEQKFYIRQAEAAQ